MLGVMHKKRVLREYEFVYDYYDEKTLRAVLRWLDLPTASFRPYFPWEGLFRMTRPST